MPKCTNCHTEIDFAYCPRCGNKYVGKRLTMFTVGNDLLDNFFALDNSFISQLKWMLLDPKKVVQDYWNGYRKFYFSPMRFLLIATIFMGFNFLVTGNKFLNISISSSDDFVSLSLAVFFLFVPLFSFSSWLTFWKLKKNNYEHLVMNMYTISLWTIFFSLLSVAFGLLKNSFDFQLPFINNFLIVPYLLLILIWNVRCFDLTWKKRILFLLLNIVVLVITATIFVFLTSTKPLLQ